MGKSGRTSDHIFIYNVCMKSEGLADVQINIDQDQSFTATVYDSHNIHEMFSYPNLNTSMFVV